MKVSKDIESLLQWTYLDELPKRRLSSAEGNWDRLAQYGSLGGVNPDPGHGSAQRYPHFGLPHPDAELIEKAVAQLGRATVDWDAEFDTIAGDLAALVSINDVRPRTDNWRSTADGGSGWSVKGKIADRWADPAAQRFVVTDNQVAGKLEDFSYIREDHGGRWRRGVRATPRDEPRDVLMVGTVDLAALVTIHAVKGTRPDWRTDQMRVLSTPAEHGPLGKVIGTCKGKNRYTTGSYCPLRFEPSPISIVQSRADYRLWHRALCALAETLNLTTHIALAPDASPAPWIEGGKTSALYVQPGEETAPLLLKPSRKLAGPPIRKSRFSKVRTVDLTSGGNPLTSS